MASSTPEGIKTLLAAATALLAPPAPLPSAPPALLERLRASSALLPGWRTRAGWTDDDELEQIGDDDDEASPARKERRDALVQLVGRRCLDILLALQAILGKEFWPAEFKDGMGDKDFLLGTADLRVVRLMLSHAVASLLLPLTLAYVVGLPRRAAVDPRLPAAVNDLLSLLETPSPPAGGSSSARAKHSTAITLALAHSHIAPLTLAAVTLGWTPTVPPPTHAALRSRLVSAISAFPPAQAMASLSAALQTIQAGKRKPPRGWARVWPAYVEGAIGTLLSGQVQRPGGVRAVMENVFGEAGNMLGPEAVEGSKLDQIAGLLSRVPKSVPAEVYIPKLLTTLFDLIAPESASHPIVYTHAASYVVHHLWQTSPLAVEWLRARLHTPWLPQNVQPGVVVAAEQAESAARSMAQLVLHAPPSPDFTDFVVGPILPPLFALHAKLSPAVGVGSIQKAAAPAPGLAADVRLLLSSWGKVVPQDKGVAGVWSIVIGGRGWPPSDDGEELYWDVKAGRAEIVFGYPEAPQASVSTSMDVDGDDAIDSFELSPDPPTLVNLIKSFDRPDVASDVFLKVLDEWRVRASADDQDPLKSLLFLRITLAMMESLGEKLLANPDHVLAFVEGVLGDEVHALQEKAAEKKPLIQEVDADEPLPELTAEGVEKMGMVETAISLLLASLEANEKLNFDSAPILHPISNHLEALAGSQLSGVRQLAREAQLVLLVRRSTTLTAKDGTVSPAVATYRRALTLVSDPILPVRAHGLVLLRDLVLSKDYDPALTPSILDVYMQAIQDKDSYIYLNAVKGVAAMAETLGREIFKTLVRLYREGGDGVSGDALDKALRIGEALGLVIRRAGKAFAANAGIVVPVLLSTFANAKLPTILRTSALSLLSTCAEVDHLALLPWADELASAAIDLVQIESVASSPFRPEPAAKPEEPKRKVVLIDDDEPEEEAPKETGPRIVDDEPTAQDGKHPALRRAAVVFLGLLVASLIEAAGEGEGEAPSGEFQMRLPGSAASITPTASRRASPPSLAEPILERAGTVLRYVAHTDDDEVVRGQASEVVALVERLRVVKLTERISSSTLL